MRKLDAEYLLNASWAHDTDDGVTHCGIKLTEINMIQCDKCKSSIRIGKVAFVENGIRHCLYIEDFLFGYYIKD